MIRDILGGLFAITFVGLFWVQRNYESDTAASYADPVLIITAALGLLLMARGVLRRVRRGGAPATASEPEGSDPNFRKTLGLLAIVGVWIPGIALVGFPVASFLAFLALTTYLHVGSRSARLLVRDAVVAAAVVLFVYWLFVEILAVGLPLGFLA